MMLGTCNIGFVGSFNIGFVGLRCMFRLKNGLNELSGIKKA